LKHGKTDRKERRVMKNRTKAMAALALGTLTLATLAAPAVAREVARDLWLHINVHEADGGKVHVNLPISVVEKAAALLPDDARRSGRVRMGDHEMSAAQLRDLWRTVKNGPDATYVTVDEKDSKVRVAKSGRYMLSAPTTLRPSARRSTSASLSA